MEYLQTDEAKKIISDWMSEVMPEDPKIEITPEQLEKLSDDLVKGIWHMLQRMVFRIRLRWENISWLICKQMMERSNFRKVCQQ